jgi:DNA-binding transcriptional ArsR family regulator
MANRRIDAGPFSPLSRLVDVGRALAHPSRLRLLALLDSGELCVCQCVAVLGQAASTISGHLSELRRAGLVQERRDGKLVFYRRAEDPETASLASEFVARLAGEPLIAEDRALARRLRKVDVAALCAADLDLVALGLRSPAGRPTAGRGVRARP